MVAQEPTDCINAIISCGNSDVNLDVNGSGMVEFADSCESNENNSAWLSVTTVTAGTLGFTLTPNSSSLNEDYDFFVFGPNVTCGNLGSTIRCSTTHPPSANLSYNTTGMRDSETDLTEGAGENGNSFVKSLDVLAGETYFIVIDRPEGNSPFNLEWTGTATLADPPSDEATSAGTVLDLIKCDDLAPFDDASSAFNISDNTPAILGAQTDVTVTYHDSPSDANIGINPLPSPYINTTNPQTIYARLTNTNTGCFELTDFQLEVNLGPDFITPTDYVLCDNLDDGDDKNGQTIFNLSTKKEEILQGQTLADFNIFYYTSIFNAENNIDQLPESYYNTTGFNETIFVRIEEIANANCVSFTTLNLLVNAAPESFNYTLIQCDEDGLPDGLTTYNLDQAIDLLTDDATGKSTKFYTDLAKTNEITSNIFSNTVNPQIIYAEVIDNATGCVGTSELTLDFTATDANNAFLSICDDDGLEDGFQDFDLTEANDAILSGLPAGLDIVYYATYNDSVLEENPIAPDYTNTTPYFQSVFARVENNNDCFGISQIFLYVLTLPETEPEDLVYYCLDDFPDTITIDAAVDGNPDNFTYMWSNGDSGYETEINTAGEYSVSITNTNNCSTVRTVTVAPSNSATFDMPASIERDASGNNTVTIFVSGEGTYEYSLIDDNGNTIEPFQQNNIFENVFPGIYTVLVRDVKNNCGEVIENISVIGFPRFFTPNNDGVNDVWNIVGVSNMFQGNTKIKIYNRFGKLIKELSPLGEGWNGLYNGQKLPSDDYWFSVKLEDGRIFKNHFTLKN